MQCVKLIVCVQGVLYVLKLIHRIEKFDIHIVKWVEGNAKIKVQIEKCKD